MVNVEPILGYKAALVQTEIPVNRANPGVASHTGDQRLEQNVYQGKLRKICSLLSLSEQAQFLGNSYVQGNLERFYNIDPHKIKLALRVARSVREIANTITDFQSQLVPALNLQAYVILERITSIPDWQVLSSKELESQLKNDLNGREKSTIAEKSLTVSAIKYLSNSDRSAQNEQLVQNILNQVVNDTHTRLSRKTKQLEWTEQSQGIEIEVLTYKATYGELSPAEKRRGVDAKWLPRGLPLDQHKRTDWNILPLLGIEEDIGERKYQVYEMSTNPTDTVAPQKSIIWNLIRAGFITEGALSGGEVKNPDRKGKEAFSLHVSTVFPSDIISPTSLSEYRTMVRALGSAYATDQRMGYGGFMSGGEEIWDKTIADNIKPVDKSVRVESNTRRIPKGYALIETRNLDVSLLGQFQALEVKQVLDFSFRSAWERHFHPYASQTPIERVAADRWKLFMRELQRLNNKYGISSRQLHSKYGNNWEKEAWREISHARETQPQFKSDVDRLLRRVANDIKKSYLRIKQTDEYIQREAVERTDILLPKKFLVAEPLSTMQNQLFISEELRKKFGLKIGDTITIRVSNQTMELTISKAKKRGDGTIESEASPYLRVSSNVLAELNLPNGYALLPVFDPKKRVLEIAEAELQDFPVIKTREPRPFIAESGDKRNDLLFLTTADRRRLGLQIGDEIAVRFGKSLKKVSVASDKDREGNNVPAWKLSSNVLEELHIPEDIALRSRWDYSTGELAFGPVIALTSSIKDQSNGVVEIVANKLTQQAAMQAQEYGALFVVIDKSMQQLDLLKQGFVIAYQSQGNNEFKKIVMPIPDVIYDKQVGANNMLGKEVVAAFKHAITPRPIQVLVEDKLKFAEAFRESKLAEYHPATVAFGKFEDFSQFLDEHENVILKPRFGSGGRGIIKVTKEGNHYKTVISIDIEGEQRYEEEVTVNSKEDLYTLAKNRVQGVAYTVQEKIPLVRYLAEGTIPGEEDIFKFMSSPEARVIMQRGIDGDVQVTGVVMRLNGQVRELHVDPIRVLKDIFPGHEDEIFSRITDLGVKAHKIIEKVAHDKPTGELAVDIGITNNGDLCIIEANAKPVTRAQLADLQVNNPDGLYNSTARPIEYALFLTDMV